MTIINNAIEKKQPVKSMFLTVCFFIIFSYRLIYVFLTKKKSVTSKAIANDKLRAVGDLDSTEVFRMCLYLVQRNGVTFSPNLIQQLTLFRMALFRSSRRWKGVGKKASLLRIHFTYPTMMKRGTVKPKTKRNQKIYKLREFC